MTNDQEFIESQAQRRSGARTLVLLPPLALLLTAALLILTSPLSWGAASIIEAPGWMPPLLGGLSGIGALLVARYALRQVLRATDGDFEVFGLQVIFGTLVFIGGTAMLASLITRLPSEATYRRVLDVQGEIGVSVAGFFFVSLILGALQLGVVWAGAYLYSHAFTNQRPTRISLRRSDEVDGIGELLKERE